MIVKWLNTVQGVFVANPTPWLDPSKGSWNRSDWKPFRCFLLYCARIKKKRLWRWGTIQVEKIEFANLKKRFSYAAVDTDTRVPPPCFTSDPSSELLNLSVTIRITVLNVKLSALKTNLHIEAHCKSCSGSRQRHKSRANLDHFVLAQESKTTKPSNMMFFARPGVNSRHCCSSRWAACPMRAVTCVNDGKHNVSLMTQFEKISWC